MLPHDARVPLFVLDAWDDAELAMLAGADFLLVRPDQHIAWRGDAHDPGAILDIVTGRRAPVAS